MPYPIEAEVQPDGMLHLEIPDARPGERLRVVIEKEEEPIEIEKVDGRPVRVFGLSKGRGRILPDFDDPIKFG